MSSEAVLFVTVEGVLGSARALAAAREVESRSILDPVAVGLLALLCRETRAGLILGGHALGTDIGHRQCVADALRAVGSVYSGHRRDLGARSRQQL